MENTNVPENPRFEKREMRMLASVFAAVLLHVLFSRNDLSGSAWELPGLGLAASLFLVQAGFAAYMGKRGRWTLPTWLLLAASALLNLRFALFASEGMWLLNLPVALGAVQRNFTESRPMHFAASIVRLAIVLLSASAVPASAHVVPPSAEYSTSATPAPVPP